MIVCQQTSQVNVPSIITSAGIALPVNEKRTGWTIFNAGTNPLFVLMSNKGTESTLASTILWHVIAPAGTIADDGTGGTVGQEQGVVFTGQISVAGTSPRFVVTEFAA